MNFRVSCVLSLIGLALFHLITYAWPFLPLHELRYNGTVQSLAEPNQTTTTTFHTEADSGNPVGCNTDKFHWCDHLHRVNVHVYYTTYVLMIGLAYTVLNIAMTTLFSRVLGPRRQGTQQGLLQMSGGVARMVGPVVMSSLYALYGPVMAWNCELLVIGVTLLLWILFYCRMVQLRVGAIVED